MRRVTYSLLNSALKAKDSCAAAAASNGRGGAAGGRCGVGSFDLIGAVKSVRRGSAKALADAEAGIPARGGPFTHTHTHTFNSLTPPPKL